MTEIIEDIRLALTANGATNVYSAFDAKPIREKGEFFTVIRLKAYEQLNPIYDDEKIYIPFKADVELIVTAPARFSQDELCSYYENKIEGAVNELSGINNRLKHIGISMDKNLSRLVLTAEMNVGGMKKILKETEETA